MKPRIQSNSRRVGEAEILLISVGALEEAKDPLTTFEIVRRLVKTGVSVKLVMAGAGPLLETLKDMARQPDLQGVVTML
ncbi:MAG: glycosyltransferase, partial [Proteobacteria bacterium]|nr:glycosyltransferase [Pseudomonadota bacterium]